MNPKRIMELLGRLAMLKYFPANNDSVFEGLLVLVGEMCRTELEVEWLVKRMTSGIYAEWPGPQEMRACYCSKFCPKDGINAYSQVYPEGLPLSPEARKALEAPTWKALPAGIVPNEPVQDPPSAPRKAVPPVNPNFRPITQDDIDKAVEAVRKAKAEATSPEVLR